MLKKAVLSLVLLCAFAAVLEAFVYAPGQRVQVIAGYGVGRLGTVKYVTYAGVLNTIPPTYFGEIDYVLLDGELRQRAYYPYQLVAK